MITKKKNSYMKGKEKCDYLGAFRKKIAEDNGIVLEQKDCTHEGDCLGTCPMCDAESSYLLDELRKKDVIHLNADGKLIYENIEVSFDEFSKLTEQMDDSLDTDYEPREYLGNITTGVFPSDSDTNLRYDELNGEFVSDSSPFGVDDKDDGWD